MANNSAEPRIAKDAVLIKSKQLPSETPIVKGYEWNDGVDYDRLFNSYKNCGFQATNFGKAIDEINKMVCSVHFSSFFFLFVLFNHSIFDTKRYNPVIECYSWIAAKYQFVKKILMTMRKMNLSGVKVIVRYF